LTVLGALAILWSVGAGEPVSDSACDVLPVDARVGGFRIRGLVAEGAMGQVYLAQDATLGRRVALKLIKRSMMRADGIERFLEEARATARFSHPHIVTLHAVGEHDGRPYLALEYVDGESLRARLATGPLAVRDALRIARAIAEALAEAHRRDLVHADLKPENVVIPPDGRVRLVDFGLARLIGTTADSASGTPAYMAPERWRGEPPRGAIDVWALGVLLHELATGVRPIADAELARLAFGGERTAPYIATGAAWSGVVASCLALDPAARPTADDLVRRLTALLDPRAAVEDETRCPFPGLAPFSRGDARDYFGRRDEIEAIVEGLRTRPLIPIVGPSGVGKSSFVYAALIPRLEDAGPWSVCALRPGAAPFERLAAAVSDGPAPALASALRREPEQLALALGALAAQRNARVLLFLDQFEETFTLAGSDAIAFCECVAFAAIQDEPWRIVLTVRDDFFGRLAGSPAMRRQLGAVMALAPLSAADLRAAVLGPLANAGYAADEPALVDRLVRDVEIQPARLPLLQFACRSLWDRRDPVAHQVLTRAYEAIGGASGALAAHAQQLVAQLSPVQVRLARKVLLALINPDGTRRPRLRSELAAELPAEVGGEVVDHLLNGRLIVASREADTEDSRLEVAHEALAAVWPQLARWLDETYEERLLVTELKQAAQLWQRLGRRDDATWAGTALAEAVRRVAEWNVELPSVSRAFLDAGVARQRRTRRRRRRIVGAIAIALIATTVVAVVAAIGFARKQREAVAQQAEIRLAAADMGIFELAFEPFDWDHAAQQRVAPVVVPSLRWQLRAVDPDDPRRPGRVYGDGDVRRGVARRDRAAIVELVEARSGPAFLEIDGRGECAPSRLFLQHVPGYAERRLPYYRIRVAVPTCQASTADAVEIAAGAFHRNVNRGDGTPPYDELASGPAFAIDRTEVTRGAFAIYEQMDQLTGDDAAAPDDFLSHGSGSREAMPIVGVNYRTAINYCAFHGKTLPTIDQWQKAFRGGLEIGGQPNPHPLRDTPWHITAAERPANLKPRDGTGAAAPVGSYAADTSPYGIVDLAGNVAEWSASPANEPRLRAVLGGGWGTPVEQHAERIVWRNSRAEIAISYEIGFRCVSRSTAGP
jgi:eukaryotic-like serine/threonine-protein kinase